MSKNVANAVNIVRVVDIDGWFKAQGTTPTPDKVAAIAVPLIAHFEVELHDHDLEWSENQLKCALEYDESMRNTELDEKERQNIELLKWMAYQSVKLQKARAGIL